MADQDARALLLTIQANTELLRSNLSAAERAIGDFQTKTQEHLDRSDERFETLGKSLEALEGPLERVKAVGETAFAFLVGESLIEKGKEALEFAGNIQFMATQIGVSTDFLQKFRYAASQSGASIEVTDTALTKFSRSVGEAANGDTALVKLFNSLGVNVLDAGGKVRTIEGVFRDTADAIQKLPDPAQRTADTMTLLGRGAGALVPVLAGGTEGFNQLSAAASELGIVLGPELIEHSEQVNHKLAALKLILDAQMSSAIAQNAGAIEQLAGAMVRAAGAVATFLNQHPDKALAIAGGLAGLKVGGLAGGVAGAAIGLTLGRKYQEEQNDENTDVGFRKEQLDKARNLLKADLQARRSGAFGSITGDFAGDIEEVRKQDRLTKEAIEQRRHPKPVETDLGSPGKGDHNPDITKPKKERVDHSAERAANNDRAYQAELQQAQDRYAKAMLALSDTAEARYQITIDELNATKAQRDLEIDDQVKAKKISQAQADKLRALNASTTEAQKEEAARKENSTLLDQFYALAAIQLQGQIDAASVEDRLATTRKQRLAIELRLNDYLQQQAIAAQQKIIDDLTSTKDQRDRAAATIGNINKAAPGNRALIEQQNQSPLDAYRQQLHDATDDTNDALQRVAVTGLQGLENQLSSTFTKVLGLKGAFGELASEILADLARIEIERAILGAIGGGSGGGGLLSSIFGGGRAGGGDVDGSKFYIVGENGPELFAPGQSGSIIPNGAIRAPSLGSMQVGGGNTTVTQHFDFTNSVVPQAVYDDASRKAAMAYTNAVAHTNRTVAGLRRPSL